MYCGREGIPQLCRASHRLSGAILAHAICRIGGDQAPSILIGLADTWPPFQDQHIECTEFVGKS
jgi:hypothetical protein